MARNLEPRPSDVPVDLVMGCDSEPRQYFVFMIIRTTAGNLISICCELRTGTFGRRWATMMRWGAMTRLPVCTAAGS